MSEKRQHSRVDSIFLLTYVHLDKDDNQIMQGMGRTINVSESGIMLETHVAFENDARMDVVLGVQEEMVTIRGKVIFSQVSDPGRYQSGIEFLDIQYRSLQILRRYIQAFKEKSLEEK
jgi:hypothetical protein